MVSILCHAVLNKRGLLSQDPMHQAHPDPLPLSTLPTPNDPAITVHALAHVAPLVAISPNQMLSTLALLVGVFIFAMGLFRFGSFSRLLSTPLVSAFTCAAALQVACSQLPPIFGIRLNQRSGPLSLPLVSFECDLNSFFYIRSMFSPTFDGSEEMNLLIGLKKIIGSLGTTVVLTENLTNASTKG